MTERKILIIEKASELFAKNGFDATSVQEITDACGISKGSFYLSFKSKESLLFSIFEYFSQKLIGRMNGLIDLQVTPRERFELFFSIQFEEIARYSDFILMQIREQTNPGNDEMMGLMNNLRGKAFETMEKLLMDLYGEQIHEHLPDLIVLLNGIIHGYVEIIVFNKKSLNYTDLASYIFERTDSIVKGLDKPFLSREMVMGVKMCESTISITVEELLEDIDCIKQLIECKEEDVVISLDVIAQELSTSNFRKPVISGMMSNLKQNELTKEFVSKLKLFLDKQ